MRDARRRIDVRLKAEHFQKEKQWALGICELEELNAGLEAQNEDLRQRKRAGAG